MIVLGGGSNSGVIRGGSPRRMKRLAAMTTLPACFSALALDQIVRGLDHFAPFGDDLARGLAFFQRWRARAVSS